MHSPSNALNLAFNTNFKKCTENVWYKNSVKVLFRIFFHNSGYALLSVLFKIHGIIVEKCIITSKAIR